MKGISSKVTKALPTQAKLDCADNTGAKVVQLINVLKKGGVAGRYPAAGVGDMIRVTVRRGTPETRRQIFTAVIIRQSRPFRSCLLYTSPSPRDRSLSRMPSSA